MKATDLCSNKNYCEVVVKMRAVKKDLYGIRTQGPLRYNWSALPNELTSQMGYMKSDCCMLHDNPFFYQENQFNEQASFHLFVFNLFLYYTFAVQYFIWTNAFYMIFLWCWIRVETIYRTVNCKWGIPFLPSPDSKTRDKQLDYCSFDWFQIVLFPNIPQYFYDQSHFYSSRNTMVPFHCLSTIQASARSISVHPLVNLQIRVVFLSKR